MRIRGASGLADRVPEKYDQKFLRTLVQQLDRRLIEMHRTLAGNLGFGDGTDVDNLIGKWMEYSTNAVANTEDALAHNLGVIPVGFLLLVPPATGTILLGPTPWTTSNLYLKCNAASQTAKIFVVIPSQGLHT
jgi:hypothetical protein